MITKPVDGADELTLRVLDESDADAHFALIAANRAHLRPWFGKTDRIRSIDDSRLWLRENQQRFKTLHCAWSGVWERGRLIGTVGVCAFDSHDRSAEIGYYL